MAKRADLVIVGGGIGGVSLALSAIARGLTVTWVRPKADTASQSLHWHGYLHRGHLYDLAAEDMLIDQLRQSWRYWSHEGIRSFFRDLTPLIVGSRSTLAAERYATLLPARNPVFRSSLDLLSSDERVLDGPRYLAAAYAALVSCCEIVEGRCVGVSSERGGDASVLVVTNTGKEMRYQGTQTVIATGCDTPTLAPGFPVDVRLSRMLVLTGELPDIAFIVPERMYGSLFSVSRTTATGSVRAWLVSDNHSTIGRDADPIVDGWWVCSIVERLNQLVPLADMPSISVSAYHAPKARIAGFRPGVQSANHVLDEERAISIFCPSKWTSAPFAAFHLLDCHFPTTHLSRDDETSRIAEYLAASTHLISQPPELWMETIKWRGMPAERVMVKDYSTIAEAASVFLRTKQTVDQLSNA